MRLTSTLLLLALCFDLPAEIVTIADWPCSEWSERRQSRTRLDPPQMWLSGFMTGLASAHQVDALAVTDAATIFTWMDGFCARKPDETIAVGGILLFEEIRRRLPTTPPRLSQLERP